MPIEQYREVVLFLLVSIAAIHDLATRRISNRLLLAGLACALFLGLLSGNPGASLLMALAGMLVGLAMFLPFYLMRGMAAGDVKMMAVVGAFTGPDGAFEVAVLSWCAGGVMTLLVVLLRGRLRLVLGNLGRMLGGTVTPGVGIVEPSGQTSAGVIPYGPAIALGAVVFLVRQYG